MSEADQQTQTKEDVNPIHTQGNKSSDLIDTTKSHQLDTHNEESKELISLLNFNPQIKAKRFLTR